MKSFKKSQAAIEFLVTYGWAILGVIVVLGALTYFGIFNTQKYTQDMCNLGDQFRCEDYIVHQDGWIAFKIRNNFGVSIDITKVELTSDYGNNPDCALAKTAASGSLTEIKECKITSGTFPINDKARIKIKITFKRTLSENVHIQTGDIIATVQPAGTCSNGVLDCHGTGCEAEIDCGGPCGAECVS